jgi:MFS family permease
MSAVLRFLPPAFSKPRFRLFAAGQAVSIIGSWIQQVALSWLVYRLTGSVFLLGVTGFVLQIPHLFIAPVAGIVVDRLPRVRLLIAINLALATLAMALAALALSGTADIRPFLAIALLIGIANACESPARQSLLGDIVEDRALLPSAIGFNSVLFNTGRMIGPAIAGVLLVTIAEAWCFIINAVSFLAIVSALFAMRLPDEPAASRGGAAAFAIREMLAHLGELPAARYFLPLSASVALFALPMQHLMPSIAVAFFGGEQGTVGLLMSASGLGALMAAATISMQRGAWLQFRLVQMAPIVSGLALAAFSQTRTLWLALPLLAINGAAVLSTSVSTNTLLQQSVGPEWRGRVIGLYFMSFLGMAPLGTLLAGALADRFGLGATVALNGLMIALVAILVQARLRATPGALSRLRRSVGS